jgi:dTDP-4-amino-4,6-dideoxygalactose transaminase
VPAHCGHNAHLYYLLLDNLEARTRFIERLKHQGIATVFHYVPLHSAPAGRRFGRVASPMTVTDSASARLARLPLWLGIDAFLGQIIDGVYQACGAAAPRLAA